ncbi:MAG: hypothetical protein RLN60_01360 [Phycisphaerales bacterium]
MADLLQKGSEFLESQRHQHMTRPVVYLRGGESVQLDATVGRTVFEQQDQFGMVQRTESRDYLVRTSDLVLNGSQAEPKVGDRVREPSGTSALLYEVMSIGNEPPFRFSDPERSTLRIHTKFVGLEVSP